MTTIGTLLASLLARLRRRDPDTGHRLLAVHMVFAARPKSALDADWR